MPTSIQVTSINGEFIKDTLWEAEGGTAFKERQPFYLEIECNDKKIINLVNSGKAAGCLIDEEDGNLSVKCRINSVFHYLNVKRNIVTTFVKVIPENRDVENIIFYIFDKSKCSEKFIQSLT